VQGSLEPDSRYEEAALSELRCGVYREGVPDGSARRDVYQDQYFRQNSTSRGDHFDVLWLTNAARDRRTDVVPTWIDTGVHVGQHLRDLPAVARFHRARRAHPTYETGAKLRDIIRHRSLDGGLGLGLGAADAVVPIGGNPQPRVQYHRPANYQGDSHDEAKNHGCRINVEASRLRNLECCVAELDKVATILKATVNPTLAAIKCR
jgi:hypothetical protein